MLVQTYYAYTVHVRTRIHVQTNYLYTSTCTCTCTAHIYTHMHTHTHTHTHTQIFCAECAGYVANLKYLDNKPGRVCHTCCIKLKGGEDSRKGSVARDPCPVTSLPTPSRLLLPRAAFTYLSPHHIPNRCLLTRIVNRFSAQTQEEVVRD